MRLFRFDRDVGRPIDAFGSQGLVMSRIVRHDGGVQVGCMHLGAGGRVGRHDAVVGQLFLVVEGSGWVQGQGAEPMPIRAGQAAFWTAGESHAAGTDAGMTAVVIEGEGLDPSPFMAEAH